MKNDNDWMDYLREEEANFLPEPPDGLWEGIESRLPTATKRHRVVPMWLRYCGMAACVALVFGVGLRLLDKAEEKPLANKMVVEKNNHESTLKSPILPIPSIQITDIQLNYFVKSTFSSGLNHYVPARSIPIDEDGEPLSLPQKARTILADCVATEKTLLAKDADVFTDTTTQHHNEAHETSPHENRTVKESKGKTSPSRSNALLAFVNTKNKNDRAVSVSLYAGNLMANNTAAQGGFNVLASAPSDDTEGDNPYGDIADLNQGVETETKRHYRLPLRAGIRVSFPLTDRLALESGVTYTRLSSSIESGSQDNYYNTEQTLHYVGIPLKLRCNLWQGKRVGVYVSGGGMVEKCVSGKAETDFYVGGDKHTHTEQSISEKPLQLSAMLSAGIEANIAKGISLFAEPGMSYYFDNHSSVDNAYKHKPLNMDLNIGIRVNINK